MTQTTQTTRATDRAADQQAAGPRPAAPSAPAPSSKDVHQILDLALRIGEVPLSSGAGAADVAATMHSIAVAAGLRGADVDVTFTALSMSYQTRYSTSRPIYVVRNVKHRDIDYERPDRGRRDLVRDLLTGRRRPRGGAHPAGPDHLLRPPPAAVGGRPEPGVMGRGWRDARRGLDGGGRSPSSPRRVRRPPAAADARHRLPSFYKQVAGGLLATLIAVGSRPPGSRCDPSPRGVREHHHAAVRASASWARCRTR